MDPKTLTTVARIVMSGTLVSMFGIAAYCFKKQAALNAIIAEGHAQIDAWNKYASRSPLINQK